MSNLPIAIFDSGLGGLSIWLEIKKLLPNEDLIYLGDQAFCPYASKSEDEICDKVVSAISFLVNLPVKIVVIACNTAMTVWINYYRQKFPNLPIIGVVPVIKTAAENTRTKNVLLMGTRWTVFSPYVDKLIAEFGQECEFFKWGDDGKLVSMIENGKISDSNMLVFLEKKVGVYESKNIDTVVLGCTHFPFLKKRIMEIMGESIQIIDSGKAVARQVKRILKKEGQLAEKREPRYTFYTTGGVERFVVLAQKMIGDEFLIERAEMISI